MASKSVICYESGYLGLSRNLRKFSEMNFSIGCMVWPWIAGHPSIIKKIMRCFPSINVGSFMKPSHLGSSFFVLFFGLRIFKHCIVVSMSCTLANSLHVLAINIKPNIDLSNRAIGLYYISLGLETDTTNPVVH